VFVAGKAGYELGEWSDNQIAKDFGKFLTNFVDQSEFQIEEAMMSRWHKDEDSLGSYCFNKVGTRVEHFEQFRKPIDNKLWFVGEHTHPKLSSYAHGAYETGLWGAQEVVESLKGGNEEFEGEGEDIDENDD
jgi:monoamine oxidase